MPLKPFQTSDIARAAMHDGVILAWEPGMGKSLAAVAWPLVKKARRTLIVAPGSLHHQLTVSASKFFRVYLNPLRNKQDFFDLDLHRPSTGPPRFYITSYTALGLNEADEWSDSFARPGSPRPNRLLVARRRSWGRRHNIRYDQNCGASIGITKGTITCIWSPTLARLAESYGSFDCVVVDEGTRLQATNSRIGSSIRLLQPRFRLVLTGTPIKNRLESIFWLCAWSAGHTGRWPYSNSDEAKESFARDFHQKEEHPPRKPNARSFTKPSNHICSLPRLWRTLSPIIIRRRKSECGCAIAPKIVTPVFVKSGTAQLAVYRHHLENPPLLSGRAKPVSPRTRTGMQLTNLRLAALCPDSEKLARAITAGQGPKRSWTEWTPKLFATLEIIRDCLARGKQVLVGSPFRNFSSALCSKLSEAEVSCVLLDGGTPPTQRGLLADEFKRGIHSVLVAGLKAMGEGHSFENCSELILPGLSFAYDENEQFIHRVWRINSPDPVRIHLLVLEGSIDEKLHEIYTEKGDSSDLAIDGRLFREPISNPDPVWIIREAARIFQKNVPSTDEQILIDSWETSLARQLRLAHLKYLEHKPASGPDANERRAAIELTDLPSPTQHSVDILRKHYKAGTFSRVTSKIIATSIAKLKAINRQHRAS
jgi:hypothetical protein